jgi:hypothetical protein
VKLSVGLMRCEVFQGVFVSVARIAFQACAINHSAISPFKINVLRRWRLRPGVSLTAATEEANVIGTALRPPPDADAPKLTARRFGAQPLKAEIVGDLRPALRVLLASVLVVHLIVCANTANLLLARGSARQREIAVRSALGASQGRIVRQLLTESLVLAAIGGAIGALFGAGGVALVKALAEIEAPGIFRLALATSILPRLNEVAVDLKMFGIAFCVAAIAGLVFAIVPAQRLSRANQHHPIGARGGGSDRTTSRFVPSWPPRRHNRAYHDTRGSCRTHSARSAAIGSTRVARRTGTINATAAQPTNVTTAAPSTVGSNGDTS